MLLKKLILLSLLLFNLKERALAQSDPIQIIDNKCFTYCGIPPNSILQNNNLYIYTGTEEKNNPNIQNIRILTKKKSSQWVKKMGQGKCHSRNPEDCMVICLVDSPEEYMKLIILDDTTSIKQFTISKFSEFTNLDINEIKFEKRTEVLCPELYLESNISQIQKALLNSGYTKIKLTGIFDKLTKEILQEVQENNNLPLGHIDFLTLQFLGIKIGD